MEPLPVTCHQVFSVESTISESPKDASIGQALKLLWFLKDTWMEQLSQAFEWARNYWRDSVRTCLKRNKLLFHLLNGTQKYLHTKEVFLVDFDQVNIDLLFYKILNNNIYCYCIDWNNLQKINNNRQWKNRKNMN